MKPWPIFPVAVSALILATVGCLSSPTAVDLPEREPIPSVADLDFGGVTPAREWDYWELRWMLAGGHDSILGSGGPMARSALPPETLAALNELAPETGFAQGCLPAHCFKFLPAVSDGEVELHTTPQGLRTFLGEVGSLAEAALLLDAHEFRWDDGQDTGWRGVSSGWEFVVLETVSFCTPVQTDRVRLLVDFSGQLRERAREVWRRLEGACV